MYIKKNNIFYFFLPQSDETPPPPSTSSCLFPTPFPPLPHPLSSPLGMQRLIEAWPLSPLSSLSPCLSLCPLPAWLCVGMAGQGRKRKRKKRVCDGLGRKLTHTKKQEKMPRNAARNAHTHTERKAFFFLNSVLQMDSRLIRLLSNESDEYTQMWNVNN